jgi:hypothetical protein
MITSDELMSHAARCNRLAEASKDKEVAEKFRQLARDYRCLAGEAPHSVRRERLPPTDRPASAPWR